MFRIIFSVDVKKIPGSTSTSIPVALKNPLALIKYL
jgi:hypothetical protein